MIEFIKNRSSYPDDLTVWQVAQILDCPEQYVYRLLRDKKIAHYRVSKRYHIDADDLVRFIKECRVEADRKES